MEHMVASAPPFLAPREIMETLEVKDKDPTSGTSSSERSVEESSDDDFPDLSTLKEDMPPCGVGRAPRSLNTPAGELILMGRTENDSATYLNSGSACLDFFFQVVPSTHRDTVVDLLKRAWKEDSLTALKLMFHLRGVRGTGKSDKERFYPCALWLHAKHPSTLRLNLATVAEFGYFKDILEVLLQILEGPEVQHEKLMAKLHHKGVVEKGKANSTSWNLTQTVKKMRAKIANDTKETENPEVSDSDQSDWFVGRRRRRGRPMLFGRHRLPIGEVKKGYYGRKGTHAREAKKAGTLRPREERIAASLEADRSAKETAASKRREKRFQLTKTLAQRFYQDDRFQALYLQTAQVFASQLKEDLKALHEDRLIQISLAAKWTPSLDSSYDLRTLLCYAIATQIFPKDAFPEYESIDDQRYGALVRERLRKEVLVPLRKVLELPEVYMSASRWGDVNYRRVASVAMTNYKETFLKHDGERFNKFLEDVKSGKEKMAAGALLPHEILNNAVKDSTELAEVAELQWKRMVQDLKDLGSLNNCIAVCDVSGSMAGEPMDVCIALGILLSDLSEEPWKGHVITFSRTPEVHLIEGESLKDKHSFTSGMDWGMNTDLQLVFEKLLTMAQLNKLPPEKMIKRLFIFSDMEFDQARQQPDRFRSRWNISNYYRRLESESPQSSPWDTDYHVISQRFANAGYGSPPEIVFWNLRNSSSIPVVKSQQGVALVSGFSKNLLKIFLEKGGVIDPITVMNAAIKGQEYEKLAVVD